MRPVAPSTLLLLVAALFAGCAGEPWQTKDISGLMPPLQLRLNTAGGSPLTEADLRGSVVLMAFGYGSCPDVCPTTLARLAELRRRLDPGPGGGVRILFVSVDPRRDTPQRLADFAGHFGPGIVGATGTDGQLRALARRYRTTFSIGEPDARGFYEVAHSSGVYVFDQRGRARLLFRQDDPMTAMEADLRRLLG